MNQPTLSLKEFTLLQKFVHSNLGIWLPEGKLSMVEQRIRPLVQSSGLLTFGEFLERKLDAQANKDDLTAFVDRITTNHTYFSRETEHFDLLRTEVLPEVVRHVQSQNTAPVLRMWCCAASRGHEPYTLAMIQRQFLGSEYIRWDAGLLATDISTRSLDFARMGRYADSEVKALPSDMQKKFFFRAGGEWEVIPALKEDVLFRYFNLNAPRYSFRRRFDIVFCRNVLIYFDAATKLDVVRKIATQVRKDGYLFVGLAESLGRETSGFSYVQPGVYRKTQEA